MQAIFWHKKTLPALWNCKQKTKLSFCWHKTVQSFFRLLSIFFLSKLTSFLYYFVKKRKREREKTQHKVESFWHKLTGERTDENYQLPPPFPPLYCDCFRFIIYSTANLRKNTANFWQKIIIWVGKVEKVLCPWPFFCLGFWGTALYFFTLFSFLPLLFQQRSILRD